MRSKATAAVGEDVRQRALIVEKRAENVDERELLSRLHFGGAEIVDSTQYTALLRLVRAAGELDEVAMRDDYESRHGYRYRYCAENVRHYYRELSEMTKEEAHNAE